MGITNAIVKVESDGVLTIFFFLCCGALASALISLAQKMSREHLG